MAHDKGPCGPIYEDYEDLNRDYQNKSSAVEITAFGASVITVVSASICLGIGWTDPGTIPCVSGLTAVVIADSRLIAQTRARNIAYEKQKEAWKQYKDCVGKHKWYYGEQNLP